MNSFLRETLDRVDQLLNQSHISFETKQALQDLVAVINNLEEVKSDNTGMSADKRYLQAKLTEAVNERRKAEKKLEQIKMAISQELPPMIKDLSGEIQSVAKQGKESNNASLTAIADRLRSQLRLVVETLTSAVQK